MQYADVYFPLPRSKKLQNLPIIPNLAKGLLFFGLISANGKYGNAKVRRNLIVGKLKREA